MTLDLPSNPEIIAEGHRAKNIPGGFLKLRLRKTLPELETIIINDAHYLYISEHWFLQLVDWTSSFVEQQIPGLHVSGDLPKDFVKTYAMFMSSIANLVIARSHNVKSSALIGAITARNVEPWEKIPGSDKLASYIIVLDEHNMMVYDIVTKQLCKLHDFPNKDHIVEMVF